MKKQKLSKRIKYFITFSLIYFSFIILVINFFPTNPCNFVSIANPNPNICHNHPLSFLDKLLGFLILGIFPIFLLTIILILYFHKFSKNPPNS